ncbi:MAG TPA: hypothetical protein VN830_07330 [Verrucomicrobiae bacterium]|nr:hypothetical protein [Verrucomicrobiae bacterium]
MKIRITGIRDGLLVVGLAILLCLFGVSSFELADKYHVNEVWVFFAWNSILAIPLFVRGFRGHLKRASLIAFLAGLAVAHGLIMVSLMTWVPLVYWFPLIAVELFAGAWAAYRLFGVLPSGNI